MISPADRRHQAVAEALLAAEREHAAIPTLPAGR
jgi:hypothetical protein